MKTNRDIWAKVAEQQGIPLRTLDQVKADLEQAKKNDCEVAMANLMLKHGRLTDEARDFIIKAYGG